MKKILIAGGIVVLGIAAFLFSSGVTNHSSASASTKDKVILFGKVDFSDDDKDTELSSNKTDDKPEESWFEHFIKTHKTRFSKTIRK